MSRNSEINWSDEMAKSAKVLGKSILRFFGWILNILMTIMLVGLITGTVVGGAFLLYAKNNFDTNVDNFDAMLQDKGLTTFVSYIDDDGNIVEMVSERLSASGKRVWVKYEDLNEYIANAFIAIEDKRFESHDGVDWLSTVGVTMKYFMGMKTRGGSTITQQLYKNVTGKDDVTIQRKAQEILCALELEKKYDKTEIMEMYLNQIYLAQGCNGVGAAAYTYFSKEVKDLTLIESAAIAAITQNPYYYDPILNPENNQERRDTIIYQMYDQEMITQEEYEAAYKKELVLNVPGADDEDSASIRSWYTDAAQQEATKLLQDKYGYSAAFAEKLLLTGGYNIITAQDPEVQAIVEDYYINGYWQSVDTSPVQPESACVVIDPSNGNVLALVGARGKKTLNLGLNYATQTKRPPGSAIKPISVYGPGLEKGVLTYSTVVDDSPVNFGTEKVNADGSKSYSNPNGYPANSPRRYRGLTTVHEGIKVSINTLAFKCLEKVGLETAFEFMSEKVGISTLVKLQTSANGYTFTDIAFAPLAIGELSFGVTVKELTSSYQIFANGGIYNEERIVLRILDSSGNVVVENSRKSEIVITAENASIMTKMMEEVVDTGNAKAITLKKTVDCAGKTGTTEKEHDRWFVGYTPYYLCGIWFGYAMPRSMARFSASNPMPVLAWDAIMTKLTEKYVTAAKNGGEPLKTFELAPGVVTAKYCRDSGKLVTDACKADPRITEKSNRIETGYYTAGTEPTEYCDVHVLVDYDKVTGGIATPYCPESNIIQVGLLNYYREIPYNIVIEDAQYTMQYLPADYSYDGLDSSKPYYFNMLPLGYYTGRSSKTADPFNRVCSVHTKPSVPPVVVPDDTTIGTDPVPEETTQNIDP